MTTFGFDAPVIGPVLEFIADALVTAGIAVSPTGNAITVSVGTVGISTTGTAAGNNITLSSGSLHLPTNAAGNSIIVSVGSVTVTNDNDANVGINGEAVTVSVGSVSVTGDANVTPSTNQFDIILGNAAIANDATVAPTGNGIALSVGSSSVSINATVVRSWDRSTANLKATITDLVVEDDYDLVRTIAGVPDGAVIATAWLTIKTLKNKNKSDAFAVIQKTITTTPIGGQGHITNDGASGTGEVLFQLLAEDTELLTPGQWYVYDIQCETDTGKLSTREKGTLIPIQQVTQYP